MSFRQLKMLNYASKCLKITLKVGVLNFQNQKQKIPQKSSSWGDIPHVKFMPGVNPPHLPTV
jgi:hypothetical protein